MNINEYQNYHEEKTHTSAEFPYNTYLCTIPMNFTSVPLHWHNETELIVIKQGKGKVSLDLQTYQVCAGDIILVLPGHLHSIEQFGQERMEYENILFMPSLLSSSENDLCGQKFLSPLFEGRTSVATVITPELSYYEELRHMIDSIDLFCGKRPEGYQLMIKSHLYAFFFTLLSHQTKKDFVPSHRTKSLEKLKQIIKYVEEHYAEPITIEEMAQLSYYSTSHFMKFFKANMNTSFTSYLNNYRLTIAARLLTTTNSTILEIAIQTGFDNLSYFNRLFRRKYGTTPSKYRQAG